MNFRIYLFVLKQLIAKSENVRINSFALKQMMAISETTGPYTLENTYSILKEPEAYDTT